MAQTAAGAGAGTGGGGGDPPRNLTEHFQSHDPARQGGAWNALWEAGCTPWDRGGPSLALRDALLEEPHLFPGHRPSGEGTRRKRALVPGCGRGYDVLLLADLGYDVVGLEVSPTALGEARAYAAAVAGREPTVQQGVPVVPGSVTWVLGDFFGDAWLSEVPGVVGGGGDGEEGSGKFDLIFDYTFLSALHPTMRPRWAARYRDLLSRQGRLVCLEWPSRDPREMGPGPAWALPPQVYLAHLSRPGRDVPTDENGSVDPAYVESLLLSQEGEGGREGERGLVRLAHLKPRRTHPAGVDLHGEVRDWISVWKHADA